MDCLLVFILQYWIYPHKNDMKENVEFFKFTLLVSFAYSLYFFFGQLV